MKSISMTVLSLGLAMALLSDTAYQAGYAFDPSAETEQTAGQEEQVTTHPKASEKTRANGEESTISQVCKNCRLA